MWTVLALFCTTLQYLGPTIQQRYSSATQSSWSLQEPTRRWSLARVLRNAPEINWEKLSMSPTLWIICIIFVSLMSFLVWKKISKILRETIIRQSCLHVVIDFFYVWYMALRKVFRWFLVLSLWTCNCSVWLWWILQSNKWWKKKKRSKVANYFAESWADKYRKTYWVLVLGDSTVTLYHFCRLVHQFIHTLLAILNPDSGSNSKIKKEIILYCNCPERCQDKIKRLSNKLETFYNYNFFVVCKTIFHI